MLQTIALQSKCRDRKHIIGHTLGIHLAESTVRNSVHYRVFALEGAAAAEIHQTHQVAAAAAGVQFDIVVGTIPVRAVEEMGTKEQRCFAAVGAARHMRSIAKVARMRAIETSIAEVAEQEVKGRTTTGIVMEVDCSSPGHRTWTVVEEAEAENRQVEIVKRWMKM